MSGISLVVLAKDANRAKTRLGIERGRARALAIYLAGRTVLQAVHAPSIRTVFVVTSDPHIRADAVRLGAIVVPEGRPLGMNRAADLGRRTALVQCPDDPVGIVVADLPAVLPADFEAVVQEYWEDRRPLFVPDYRGEGTTMLLHGPGELPGLAFGLRSAELHCRLGYQPARRAHRGIRFDIDTADDVLVLAHEERSARRLAGLRELSEVAARR